jgi:hypothetical protein
MRSVHNRVPLVPLLFPPPFSSLLTTPLSRQLLRYPDLNDPYPLSNDRTQTNLHCDKSASPSKVTNHSPNTCCGGLFNTSVLMTVFLPELSVMKVAHLRGSLPPSVHILSSTDFVISAFEGSISPFFFYFTSQNMFLREPGDSSSHGHMLS